MAEAAAAISLVASIAPLIDLGVKVIARLNDFTTRTCEVPESFRALGRRLPLLISTLRVVQQQADAGRFSIDVTTSLRNLTQSTSTQLAVIETCLAQITPPPPDASRIHREKYKDIDFLVLHQTAQHVETSEQILGALAQLQLGQVQPSSLTIHTGHTFGSISAHDNASIILGNVNHEQQHPDADAPKKFGLCLGLAPLIEPDNFVGRAGDLKEMTQVLQPGKPAVEQRRVILGGLGGMGKTQLAIAYARQHHASYTSVFWLNATSKLTLTASFRSIAETVLNVSPKEKLDDEDVLTSVLTWLSDVKNTQWLLIFDNYDEPDQFSIIDYMPIRNGSVIVTTRLPDLVQGQKMPVVRVSPIKNLDESLLILESRSQRENVRHDPDARRLAERLAGLPLALATAGAYLRKTNLTFHQYLEAYEQRFNINPRRPVKLQEYDKFLHTTWDLTYRRLESDDPLAAKVLKLLAYFDNQEIWFEWLHAGLEDDSPDWLRDVAGDPTEFELVMKTLADYSLVQLQPVTNSYSMHSCVHDWTLAQLNQVANQQLYWYSVGCVAASTSKDESTFLGLFPPARSSRHASRCAHRQFQQLLISDEIPLHYLVNLGEIAGVLAQIQHPVAEQLYLQLLAREKTLGSDHILMLRSVHNLGSLYASRGMLLEAEKMLTQARARMEKVLGPYNITTLTTINHLGILYRDQGKLTEAEELYERALVGKMIVLEPDHISTLSTMKNLASLYTEQGRLTEAEDILMHVLAGYEKALRPDHPLTLTTINCLGVLCCNQGKLTEAEELYKRALAGKEKALGPDHISILSTVHNLGTLYSNQGKLIEAEKMLTRALAGREKVLGPDHFSTLSTVNNLGILCFMQGKLTEAEEMYKRALAGFEKAHGPKHASTRSAARPLEILYRSQGRSTEAEDVKATWLQ